MSNTINIGLIGIGNEPYKASDFDAQLALADPNQDLILEFHSEGGSVIEGFGIFNKLKSWPGKKIGRVNCAAFSIASYILMACDEIEIASNGFMMVHNPYAQVEGDDVEFAKKSEFLKELKGSMVASYAARTGIDKSEITSLMAEESYFGASQAVQLGFADRVIDYAEAPRTLQPQALAKRSDSLPLVVVAAMYGSSPGGSNQPAERPKEAPVPVTQPIAATSKAIKARFPKANDTFIVKCLDEEMAMDEVGEEYAKSMEDDNSSLNEKITALETENTELKAQLATLNPDLEPAAMDPNAMHNPGEEQGGGAQARSTGNPKASGHTGIKPVAGVAGGASSAKDPSQEWNSLVESFVAKGFSRTKAVIKANAAAPKLRDEYVNSCQVN